VSQPRQSDRHFLLVTGAYAVGDDINFVSGSKKIECGLGDANVALDTDDDARERTGGVERVECLFDFWCSNKSQQVADANMTCCVAYIIENSVLSR
jgi:hypothetical protein